MNEDCRSQLRGGGGDGELGIVLGVGVGVQLGLTLSALPNSFCIDHEWKVKRIHEKS